MAKRHLGRGLSPFCNTDDYAGNQKRIARMGGKQRLASPYGNLQRSRFPQLLTRREIEILHWVAAGKSNNEQAILLNISAETVSYHLRNIFRKFDVKSRAAAVQVAASMGLITLAGSGNKKTVETIYNSFIEGSLDPLAEALSDETEWISTAPQNFFPHAGLYRGKDAILKQVVMIGDIYETVSFLPRILVEEAGQVAVYLDVGLIHKKSGNEMFFDVAHFWTFKDGKVARYVEVFNTAIAHEQQIEGRSSDEDL
ncbi:MAG: LuxR C-terminal-related transcriptional regulator [Pseudomonadota bacterium]